MSVKSLIRIAVVAALASLSLATAAAQNPTVTLETTLGRISIELYPDKAPGTVENFLEYVNAGFYDGTIFHRVIANFMIQGGGMDADLKRKQTRAPIPNEADNGLKNERGTIAMARTPDPNSATAQFFINLVGNAPLDHRDKSASGWGYTVFGKVISGMDVVDAIGQVPTSTKNGMRDVPMSPVEIKKAWVQK